MIKAARPRRNLLGRLGERLLNDGLIPDETLRQALERQRVAGGFLGEILVSMGAVTSAQIGKYLEEVTGFPFIDISEVEIDRDVAAMLPEDVVAMRKAMPFRIKDKQVHIAMADPLNLAVVDEIRARLDRPIVPYLALTEDLDEAIRRSFDARHKAKLVLEEIGNDGALVEDPIEQLMAEVEGAPIVRLVNSIISGAISVGASDVHIEPQESNVRVRYRIDGVLHEQMTVPSGHLAACVSRLKVMSGLDIAERRRPQDGRFAASDEQGNNFDVRMSIMPTVYGEKACLRLLEKSNSMARLDKLGFLPEQRAVFEKLIRAPHGLLLVTGPTGSGKSTTLYAALNSINDATKNINTIEDPVEYKLPGVNQTQVNIRAGVTFASGLRTLVRQDPDIILVGEIRDRETAEIAVQAALTGHLVLSTLHTNDAAGAVVRLQNMGIEPYLVSAALIGVVGQRLLRTLCPHCREPYTLAEGQDSILGTENLVKERPHFAREAGCRRCNMRGTRGRTAAYEVFRASESLRSMILQNKGTSELGALVRQEGMLTMRESATIKAAELQVSLEEIVRVFAQDE